MNVAEVDPLVESTYRWSDISDILLMGIIGDTIAQQRSYGIIGFFFVTLFSTLGGGVIRDVPINRSTVTAMSQPEYLILVFTGAPIVRFVYFKGKTQEYVQTHGDAVASGLRATTGTVKGVAYGLSIPPYIMVGVLTATGSFMTRDIMAGRVPAVFDGNQPVVIPVTACIVIVTKGHHRGFMTVPMVIGPIVSVLPSLLRY